MMKGSSSNQQGHEHKSHFKLEGSMIKQPSIWCDYIHVITGMYEIMQNECGGGSRIVHTITLH